MRFRRTWPLLAAPLFILAACEQPTESTDPNALIMPRAQSCYDPDDPLCLPPPAPMDPDTSAPGYYIGPDYTMDHCTQSNDLDYDGLDDNCEYRIARRFAPMLTTHPSDDTSREPYWVARYHPALPVTGFPEGVRVMYLFSYHMDWGDPETGGSHAHSGDSEYVALDIVYNSTTKHWEVVGGKFVAHGNATYWSGNYMENPDGHDLGYPRVWVARNKHASYPRERTCNNGGTLGSDDCSDNIDEARVLVDRYRNLGSYQHQFLNCVTSENPISYPGTECFWHNTEPINIYGFCGWDLDRTDCATNYYPHLIAEGFGGIQ